MSGITPLIDTLLHQVLGKRVDIQVPKDLNAPVKPTSPGESVQALRSDSRLDPRQTTGQAPLVGRSLDQALPGTAEPRSPSQLPASTQTHFSASAQTIANVLDRFPAPLSTLRAQAPLMVAAPNMGDASQLASRLQQSIETSGLFYESHVSKWYRGEMPRQQLMLEPQMQRFNTGSAFQPLTPITSAPMLLTFPPPQANSSLLNILFGSASFAGSDAGAGAPLAGSVPSAGASSVSQGAHMSPLTQPVAGQSAPAGAGQLALAAQGAGAERGDTQPLGAAERAIQASGQAPANADGLDEAQQNVVRHQLEMLAAPSPVLRWEGDVWSGVFMALIVQMPAGKQGDSDQPGSGESEEDAGQGAWRTQMSLQVAGLGKLEVELSIVPRQLDITLRAEDEAVLTRLKEGDASLRSRLQACGFDTIHLNMDKRPQQGEGALA
ncbi:flagellar hook-length control protein FliK [Halomonas salinarum]|uniref:flagellar hook-length control protein FliK n=1 Tax=Halomonas salinarum TaxID=1158993 RepID=UPI001439BC85|nr:flagellar hook-length control protein FliK [Halomonas salinarum]